MFVVIRKWFSSILRFKPINPQQYICGVSGNAHRFKKSYPDDYMYKKFASLDKERNATDIHINVLNMKYYCHTQSYPSYDSHHHILSIDVIHHRLYNALGNKHCHPNVIQNNARFWRRSNVWRIYYCFHMLFLLLMLPSLKEIIVLLPGLSKTTQSHTNHPQ